MNYTETLKSYLNKNLKTYASFFNGSELILDFPDEQLSFHGEWSEEEEIEIGGSDEYGRLETWVAIKIVNAVLSVSDFDGNPLHEYDYDESEELIGAIIQYL